MSQALLRYSALSKNCVIATVVTGYAVAYAATGAALM